jgi:SAM-dependent methyltransferase
LHPKYIKACRACGSRDLIEIVDLGDQYLQGSFVIEGSIEPPKRRLPTRLIRCDVTANDSACGLVQLAHTFPPAVLYSNYWYRSATNETMRNHLRRIVDSAIERCRTPAEAMRVLDIGCNDGTLLSCYPEGTALYGVDPSDIARGIDFPITLVNTVFPSDRATQVFQNVEFDVITSIAMYYDLENPIEFAQYIADSLADDGIWIVEMSYLPLMLLQNSFDTICHEHLEYYSLAALEYIFEAANLRCFRAEINDINGGSIRCYVCPAGTTTYDNADDDSFIQFLRLREFEMALDTEAPYAAFRQRIAEQKEEMMALLKGLRHQGKRIHLYGASTKGNVLLQWYGIDNTLVEAAAERNPYKVGGKTLGTNIPMISEEESRAAKPDAYLVLPWHFKREFLKRERSTIKNDSLFIFPLPEIEVVSADNIDEVIANCDALADSGDDPMITLLSPA